MNHHFRRLSRLSISGLALTLLLTGVAMAAPKVSPDGIWTEDSPLNTLNKGLAAPTAKKYKVFNIDSASLRAHLDQAPQEFTKSLKHSPAIITLPMPDGTFAKFQIEESPIMEPALAVKFPNLKAYRGQGIDDPTASVRMDLTPHGFHAQILSQKGTFYVDPYGDVNQDFCISYDKRDLQTSGFKCDTGTVGTAARNSSKSPTQSQPEIQSGPVAEAITSGSTMRTYRLAVACTGQYTAYHSSLAGHSPNVADGLAAIVTAINRVDGIFERELAIHFVLVGNNDQLVFTNPNTDPYSNTSDSTMLSENQATIDNIIGNANYDIGHVFSTAGAGLAANGVCQPGIKAEGKTGMTDPINDPFYVDYVAHEVGHQFGADHTFNCVTGGCSGNRSSASAYEPGSASTIMGYTGICGTIDNLQPNSDDYFSFISLEQIKNYTTPGIGLGDCPATVNTGNNPPTVTASPHYYIPPGTPFTLTASGSDPDGDTVYYCWEQRDLGPSQSLDAPDNGSSPLFRSFYPTTSPSRTFPRLAQYGTNTFLGEKLPTVGREMRFRVTARDMKPVGAFATDDTSVTVVDTASPFTVTSPNSSSTVWPAGTYQTVEWTVGNTDVSPIFCSFVEIYLSTDDGVTYPYQLASVAANNGSARVLIPALPTGSSNCRIRIKAENNIFFDVSDQQFTIPAAVIPSNDNIANAQTISVVSSGSVSGSNVNASKEAGEPIHFNQVPGPLYTGGRSVWFRWTPSQGGLTTLSLSSTELFGVFAVYEANGSDWSGLKLPRLADAHSTNTLSFTANKTKTYYIVVDGLHDQDFGSFQLNWSTAVDNIPPTIGFNPLTNNQTIFDFSGVGGTVSEDSTVTFRIEEFNPGGTNRYWDSSAWITNGNSPSVKLAATVSSGNWLPVLGTLPPRGQTRYGNYLVYADALDPAGNPGSANIVLIRSAPDTTPPTVSLDSIADGTIFTNRALPGIFGIASDPESGIATVDVFLMRAMSPGFNYWNGTGWSPDPATLHATYNEAGHSWQVLTNLPSGGNLPNGNYQIQVSAANNEVPQGSHGISISFSVDYHPVYVWTAGSYFDQIPGNEDQNWSNPANWDPGEVPTSEAIINIPSGTPNATSMGVIDIYSLNIGGNASLSTPGFVIYKKMSFSSGIVNGGTINISSNAILEWSGGTLNGTYGIASGASLIITNSVDKYFNTTHLTNNGTIVWYGDGRLMGSSSTVLHNNGLFDARNDTDIYNYSGGTPHFNNAGTFRKSASTNQTVFRNENTGWVFHNNGTVDIQTGILSLQSQSFLNNGGSFTGPGTTRIDQATTTLTGTTTVASGSTVEFAGGNLTGAGGFGGQGTFAWSGGVLSGAITVESNANLSIRGNNNKSLTGHLGNAGMGQWIGSGQVFCASGSAINNSGSFSVQNDSTFYNNSGGNPQPAFNNSGFFTKTSGTGVTDFPEINGGVAMNNSGVVQAQSGVISLGGGGTNYHGTFTADAAGRIDFVGGLSYFAGGVTVNGAGITRLTAGTVRLAGSTNTIVSGGTFEQAGGTMDGTGAFAGPGLFNWTGGNISAVLDCLPTLNLSLSGSVDKYVRGATINQAGTATWTGEGRIMGQSGSVFNNSGTFNIQNEAQFYNFSGGNPAPTFNNTGTLRKSVSTNQTVFRNENGGWIFNNAGIVDIQSGVLSLQSRAFLNDGGSFSGNGSTRVDLDITTLAGTSTITSGGTFEVASGTLNGIGGFDGAGTFAWSGGSISGTNTIAAGANLLIKGTGGKTLVGTLNNAGDGIWLDTGDVLCHVGSVFNNSGTFSARNDSRFYNNSGGNPLPAFNNSGLFVKEDSTGTNEFSLANGGMLFNNTGTINVQTGVIALAGGGTNTNGIYTSAAGTRIDFTGGEHSFNGNINVTGAGVTRLAGANITLGGNGNTVSSGGTFEVAAGNLKGTGSFQGAGTFSWTGGSINAQLNLVAGIAFNLSGASDKTIGNGGSITSFANTTWAGTGLFIGQNGSAFNNAGTFLIQNDSAFYNTSGGVNPVFNNTGIFRKSGATGTTLFQAINAPWFMTNSGLVDIQSGVLAFQHHASFNAGGTFSGAGITRIDNGNCYINGTSTIAAGGTMELSNGSFTGAGSLNGPGNLVWSGGTLAGSLTISPNGNLLLKGDPGRRLAGTLNQAGTAVWTNAGNINFSSGSVLNNSGLFFVQNDAQFYNITGGTTPVFNNSGILRKSGSSGTTMISSANGGVNFNNNGTVDLQSGQLAIQNPNTATAAAQLKISVGGKTALTQFAQESFGVPAQFDGKLEISLSNGFVPASGDTFAIATYPSRTGQFSTTQFPPLPNNLTWQLDYGATVLSLKVVQPATINNASVLSNGHFQFSLTGPAASSAIVQGSTNLVDWISLQTNSPFNGSFQFEDIQAASFSNRFYRVLMQP